MKVKCDVGIRIVGTNLFNPSAFVAYHCTFHPFWRHFVESYIFQRRRKKIIRVENVLLEAFPAERNTRVYINEIFGENIG